MADMAQEDACVRRLGRVEWGSLCGYLTYRTAGGLGLFRPRRRHWYVLEDWRLLSYKTRADADPSSSPLALIDLRDVAISIVPHETNQFKLVTGDKEHVFTAESHESMMVWVVRLQARRESTITPADLSEEKPRTKPTPVRSRSLVTLKGVPDAWKCPPWSTWTPQSPRHEGQVSPTPPGHSQKTTQHTTSYHTKWLHSPEQQETFQKSFKTALYNKDQEWHCSKTHRQAWHVSSHHYSTLSSSCDHDDSFSESSPEEVFAFDDRLSPSREGPRTRATGVGRMMENYQEISLPRPRWRHPTLRSLSLDSTFDNDSGIVVAPVSGHQADLQYNLTSAKLALTQALEREALLQSRLDQKEAQCRELEKQVQWLQTCENSGGENRVLEDKLRVVQRENEFLDEEVKQLVDVQQCHKLQHKNQQRKIHDLEMEIEKRKLDYVYLLESLITMPTGDPRDGLEVRLFGGNIHRQSIEALLEEARSTNPALPNYDRLSRAGVHTDCYGFKHHFHSEGLLLHYLCQHLVVHYTRRLTSSRQNEAKWHKILTSKFIVRTSVLKSLCRGGIPHHLRPSVWQRLIHTQVADIMAAKGDNYFRHLVNMTQDSQYVNRYRKQISLDLLRTMPDNFNYSDAMSDGIQSLTMVLQAFCIHNPALGYCQGMNFIAAFFLLFLNTEDSFWALVAITERYFAANYFDENLSGAQADQGVLKDLMEEKLPHLHRYFTRLSVDVSSITLNWFLTVFINAVPFMTQLRIWDCFLLEGPKVLFRFSLAMLKWDEPVLLQKTDMLGILRHLKACTTLMFDVNTLIKLAFEDMQPFPHRHQLATKHLLYLDRVRASLLKSRRVRATLLQSQRSRFVSQEEDQGIFKLPDVGLFYECAANCADGEVWVCETDVDHGDVSVISCDKVLVTSTHIKVDSRILCASAMGDIFLLGTLAWKLFAYSFKTRKKLWCRHLHDSVLCLQPYSVGSTVFAGLADGTLAVLEDVNSADPEVEPLYIPIGRLPVTSLVLMGDRLWLACGSVVHILSPRTLDTLHKITVSGNACHHISTMVSCRLGVWLTLQGTTLLQLWDQHQLTRHLCFDIPTNTCSTDRQCQGEQTRDTDITAVLMVGACVWVGTRDGHLYIYQVTQKRSRPSCLSSSGHSPSGHSPSGHLPSGHSSSGHSPSGHSSSGHSSSGHSPSDHSPSGHSPSSQVQQPEEYSSSTGAQGDCEAGGMDEANPELTQGHAGENTLPTPPQETEVDPVNSDTTDQHPPVNTTHNQLSPPTTDDRVGARSEHTFHVLLQKCKSQASPRESLILGDSVLYIPSDDSPDTSPEIIETPFYHDTFSFTFDDKPLSCSPEKGADHQPEMDLGWSPAEHKLGSSKTSSVASSVDSDRCVDAITPNDKVTQRLGNVPQDVTEECRLQGKDSYSEMRSKVKEQRPKSSNRNRVKLTLVTKMKISDKAVRSLIQTSCHRRPVVISCSGCHSDQRSLLKWRRRSDEKTWASEPVLNKDHSTN